MKAGRLRHSIIIQSNTETSDAAGGLVDSWSKFKARKADVVPLNGREYLSSQARQEKVTTRIRLRYTSGITAKMRVLWGTRVYDIKSVINRRERSKETILMCDEIL